MKRINDCFGFTLWKWIKRIEIWICFSPVPTHSHPGQDVSIIPLIGKAVFYRGEKNKTIDWKSYFHLMAIPAGVSHSFTSDFIVFLNITAGKSAADNFITD